MVMSFIAPVCTFGRDTGQTLGFQVFFIRPEGSSQESKLSTVAVVELNYVNEFDRLNGLRV